MLEREKRDKVIHDVISAFEQWENDYSCGEDWSDIHESRDIVLALLKAQEPRVMALEEAKNAYVVEYRSGKMREVGSALLDLDVDPLNAEYGKIYRYGHPARQMKLGGRHHGHRQMVCNRIHTH